MKKTHRTRKLAAGLTLAGLLTGAGSALAESRPAQDDTTTTTPPFNPKAPPTTTTPGATPATADTTTDTTAGAPTTVAAAPADPGASTAATVPGAAPLAVVDVGSTGPGTAIDGVVKSPEQAVAELGMVRMLVPANASTIEVNMQVDDATASDGVPNTSYTQTLRSTVLSSVTKEEALTRMQNALNATGTYGYTTSTSESDGISFVSFSADEQGTESVFKAAGYDVSVGTSTDLPGLLIIIVEARIRVDGPVPAVPAAVADRTADAAAFGAAQGWTTSGWIFSDRISIVGSGTTTSATLTMETPGTTLADVQPTADAIAAHVGASAEVEVVRADSISVRSPREDGDDSYLVSLYSEGDPVQVTYKSTTFGDAEISVDTGPATTPAAGSTATSDTATTGPATGDTKPGGAATETTAPPTTAPAATVTTVAAADPATTGAGSTVTTAGSPVATAAAPGSPVATVDVGSTGPGLSTAGVPIAPEEGVALYGMQGMLVPAGATAIQNEVSYTDQTYGDDAPSYSALVSQTTTFNTALTKEDVLARFQAAVEAMGTFEIDSQTMTDGDAALVAFNATPEDRSMPSYDVTVESSTESPGVMIVEVKVAGTIDGPVPAITEPAATFLATGSGLAAGQATWKLAGWRYTAGFNQFSGPDPYYTGRVSYELPAASAAEMAPIVEAVQAALGPAPTADTSDPEFTLLQYDDRSSVSVSFRTDEISVTWDAPSR